MPARVAGEWIETLVSLDNGTLKRTTFRDGRYSTLAHTREYKTLYFVQAQISKAVKIGTTTFPVCVRLAQLQTGNHEQLEVIMSIESVDPYLESDLHSLFSKDKIRGEWFRYTPEMRDFIERNKLCL
jgi:hypothetical protein